MAVTSMSRGREKRGRGGRASVGGKIIVVLLQHPVFSCFAKLLQSEDSDLDYWLYLQVKGCNTLPQNKR